jgi:hypothetical protein
MKSVLNRCQLAREGPHRLLLGAYQPVVGIGDQPNAIESTGQQRAKNCVHHTPSPDVSTPRPRTSQPQTALTLSRITSATVAILPPSRYFSTKASIRTV